jgi:hypothetical protein
VDGQRLRLYGQPDCSNQSLLSHKHNRLERVFLSLFLLSAPSSVETWGVWVGTQDIYELAAEAATSDLEVFLNEVHQLTCFPNCCPQSWSIVMSRKRIRIDLLARGDIFIDGSFVMEWNGLVWFGLVWFGLVFVGGG